MKKKHLFIIDPIEKLNLKIDTSLHLALALSKTSQVYSTNVDKLFWYSSMSYPKAKVQALHFGDTVASVQLGEEEECSLEDFHTLHMRKDPPYDLNYVMVTWILDKISSYRRVINHPQALRDYNEKLSTFLFPSSCKEGFTSSNPQQIYSYIANQCGGVGILKPLHLFGGRGILKVDLAESSKDVVLAQLQAKTQNGTEFHLAQPFDDRVKKGEVRVFTLDGEALTWCLKVPKEGEFLANTASGATLHPFPPDALIKERVEGIAKKLKKAGVYFIGFDIIGGWITEINITSPRLLVGQGHDPWPIYYRMASWVDQI